MTSNQELSLKADLVEILKKQAIFAGLSENNLLTIASYSRIITLHPQDTLASIPKDTLGQIYIVLSGCMKATSSTVKPSTEKMREYSAGEIVNLFALLRNDMKTETAYAILPSTILEIKVESLQKDNHYLTFQPIILKNLTRYFSSRLQHTEIVLDNISHIATATIQQRLEENKIRMSYGIFMTQTIILLCLYTLSIKAFQASNINLANSFIVNVIILAILAGFVFVFMKKTDVALHEFGLTLLNWKRAILESLLASFLLTLFLITLKYISMQLNPTLTDLSLFQLHFTTWKELIPLIVYVIFVPLQEFVVRGALQTSLFRFLTGSIENRTRLAIIVSNVLFVTFHLHVSLSFAIGTFIPGLIWGWLYSRHKTLIGVTLSHILFGIMSIYVIDVDVVLKNLGLPPVLLNY